MTKDDVNVVNIIAAELNPDGCYFMVFDEETWPYEQVEIIGRALQARFPGIKFVTAMGSVHNGDCGIRFLDPRQLSETQ